MWYVWNTYLLVYFHSTRVLHLQLKYQFLEQEILLYTSVQENINMSTKSSDFLL